MKIPALFPWLLSVQYNKLKVVAAKVSENGKLGKIFRIILQISKWLLETAALLTTTPSSISNIEYF